MVLLAARASPCTVAGGALLLPLVPLPLLLPLVAVAVFLARPAYRIEAAGVEGLALVLVLVAAGTFSSSRLRRGLLRPAGAGASVVVLLRVKAGRGRAVEAGPAASLALRGLVALVGGALPAAGASARTLAGLR